MDYLSAKIQERVAQLREIAAFLRNDPAVTEDQDQIERFINSDDAMELEMIAQRLGRGLKSCPGGL